MGKTSRSNRAPKYIYDIRMGASSLFLLHHRVRFSKIFSRTVIVSYRKSLCALRPEKTHFATLDLQAHLKSTTYSMQNRSNEY